MHILLCFTSSQRVQPVLNCSWVDDNGAGIAAEARMAWLAEEVTKADYVAVLSRRSDLGQPLSSSLSAFASTADVPS